MDWITMLIGLLSGWFAKLLEVFTGIFGGLLVACLVCTVLTGGMIGCAPNTEPIERGANAMMEKIIGPAVEKAMTELSTRTAQLQGQGSLINPGYVIDGFASFGPAATWRFCMRADGVSANIAGATQADEGQETTNPNPPGERTPDEPTPAVTEPEATAPQ